MRDAGAAARLPPGPPPPSSYGKASAPREPKKARPPVECEIPRRVYRGVGGRYVAEVALAQGWELRPTDVRKEVRLWWSAASHPQDASVTGTAGDS
ncbi:hypothetical protein [Streptomyces hyderabadensis]|uniref:Uncharacterized protein n=1 Tax=Streptomyces hyderabadensis TaxID=598549 RepID=A0ABP9ILE1_9ACTN|nr:hypothetical protein [Streptomyces hyderabadensis]